MRVLLGSRDLHGPLFPFIYRGRVVAMYAEGVAHFQKAHRDSTSGDLTLYLRCEVAWWLLYLQLIKFGQLQLSCLIPRCLERDCSFKMADLLT